MIYTNKTMLSYPGGKSRAVKSIISHFPSGIEEMVSPFLGGGSIELAAAANGIKIYGSDSFYPLVAFWCEMIARPRELAYEIEQYKPMSKERFYALQGFYFDMKEDPKDIGARFYALNKSSFSGSTYSGGFSKHNAKNRFTQNAIARVRNFYNPNIRVVWDTFDRIIPYNERNAFMYLDPPYLIDQKLYGNKGGEHKNFDHNLLFDLLKYKPNWIMSYNDSPITRDMYKDFEIVPLSWKYGMSNTKSKSSEILIKNI